CDWSSDVCSSDLIAQSRIYHGSFFIDATSDRSHDTLDYAHELLVAGKSCRNNCWLSLELDINLIRAVDHDFAHVRIAEQVLKRPQADRFIQYVFHKELPLIS